MKKISILKEHYYHNMLGHIGIDKCTTLIKEQFYWPTLCNDIKNYIAQCQNCKYYKNKAGKINTPPQAIATQRPFQLLCIDIAGPFNATRNRNRYILSLVDHFSKYCVLVPMKSVDAQSIARSIFKQWLTKYGMPESILSDNGKYFTSEVFQKLCQICWISRRFSPPYHQQANGLVERLIQT